MPLFFICVTAIYWLAGKNYRELVLILAGLVFYGYAALEQMLVILVLTAGTFFLGRLIDSDRGREKRITPKTVMITGVTLLLLALSYYKYSPMLVQTWNGFVTETGWPALPLPKVITPLAISFLVFQFIHYLVDKYKGSITGNSFRQFLLYALFFRPCWPDPSKGTRNLLPR